MIEEEINLIAEILCRMSNSLLELAGGFVDLKDRIEALQTNDEFKKSVADY